MARASSRIISIRTTYPKDLVQFSWFQQSISPSKVPHYMINDYLWHQCTPRTWVVDSTNFDRSEEARSLVNFWHHNQAPKGLPFLIYADKQDLPDSLSVPELIGRLGVKDLHGRLWHIQTDSSSESSLLFRILIRRFFWSLSASAATGMGLLITIQSRNHKSPLGAPQQSEIQI